jgi:hypothetical protein
MANFMPTGPTPGNDPLGINPGAALAIEPFDAELAFDESIL